MGMEAMARGAWKPAGDEQDLTARVLSSENTWALLEEDGDVGAWEARMDAAHLFSLSSPMGAYTVSDLRKMKIGLGRTVAREAPRLLTEGIGMNLRLARERAGMTQSDAASAVGIGVRTLRDMESGTRNVSLEEAVTFAVLYGTHLERLLGIISDEMESLLETYEAASPTLRKWITETVRHAQADDTDQTTKSRAIAEADWAGHLQELANDPQTPDMVRESILKRQ